MKPVGLLLLLLPCFGLAQDCNLKSSKDPYTREVKVSTGLVQVNNAQYSIEATKSQIDFLFVLDGKCFDDNSTASVFFTGTKMKSNFRNGGTMNCTGLFHLTFRNTNPSQSNLQNLASKKISAIRIKDNTNKEMGIEFNEEQQSMLMKQINCVLEEAKKLLQ